MFAKGHHHRRRLPIAVLDVVVELRFPCLEEKETENWLLEAAEQPAVTVVGCGMAESFSFTIFTSGVDIVL